jgi:hypothetical protein
MILIWRKDMNWIAVGYRLIYSVHRDGWIAAGFHSDWNTGTYRQFKWLQDFRYWGVGWLQYIIYRKTRWMQYLVSWTTPITNYGEVNSRAVKPFRPCLPITSRGSKFTSISLLYFHSKLRSQCTFICKTGGGGQLSSRGTSHRVSLHKGNGNERSERFAPRLDRMISFVAPA